MGIITGACQKVGVPGGIKDLPQGNIQAPSFLIEYRGSGRSRKTDDHMRQYYPISHYGVQVIIVVVGE